MALLDPSVLPRAGARTTSPLASVVVVSRGPSLVLARLLRSLAQVEDAAQQDVAVALVARLAPALDAQVFGLNGGSPGERRNGVTHAARGDVVLFLDDDVEVEADLVSVLDGAFADPDVIVVGGPNLTPPRATSFERVAGKVLASPVGSGPVRHRYARGDEKPGRNRSLTLCNLAMRKRLVDAQPFAPELLCAEENELLGRLAGGRIVHTPALAVFHHRRSGFYLHARQLFKYGIGRGQVVARHPTPRQLAFLGPAVAAVAVLVALLLAPLAAAIVAGAYLLAVAVEAIRVGGRHAPLAAALIVVTHAAYAAGTVAGVAYELVTRR